MARTWRDDPDVERLDDLWRRLEDGPRPVARGAYPEGNLSLTSMTGLVLVVAGLAVYATGALFGDFRAAHFFTGFVLVPLLALKLATTGWRALRYYTGSRVYRAAGPPWLLPRLLGIPLVALTVLAMASGVILWFQGLRHGTWATIHTDSAVLLFGVAGLHLLIHLRRAARAVAADRRRPAAATGRASVVAAALLFGVVLAIGAAAVEPPWHDVLRQRDEGVVVAPTAASASLPSIALRAA